MAFFNSLYKALTGKDVEALLQKLSERETEVHELRTKIASQATTITSQSTKINDLNKKLKESSDSLESIKEQLDAEQTSNKTLSLRMAHFRSRISELRNDLDAEQTSKSAIEERFNDTQVELSKANNQIEELSKKNNSHANEIKRLTDLIEKASVEKNSLKEKIETIQKSLSEAEQKTVEQTNLLQQEKEKYANAEQLLSKAESDSMELNSELSAAKSQISELSTKLQQTQKEKEEALAENLSLNKQLQELSEKIALQESIINEKTTSDNVDVAEVDVNETTDEETEEENDEYEVEENVEEVPKEDETTEFEIDWDNVELEITDVEQDTILTDSTLSITKVWDVRNKKEIDAKQFFSLPEGEIMSMRRELQLAITTDNPYWVCPVCGQMVKISGKRTARGKALFFSHLHDSDECPIKTNTGLTKRMIEARKYALVQESERHHRLKTSIANFLEETNSKNKGVSDVQIEKRVTTDLPFMNWRCPDVQAVYNGMHLVFELQLSTTFISTIVERDLFYRLNNYLIIWVFNFEENKEYLDLTNLMCKDIYYANKRNIFVFDRDAQTESFKRKELVLKCNWLNADNTWQYGPNDGDRNGIFITLDQLKFDTKNNKPYYYDAEKEYFLKHQDKVVIREKQELDLQTVLEGLERREQQKKERKELREAKKAEEKVNLETVADVVADDKVVLPDAVNAEPEEKNTLGKINANGHEYVDLGLPSGTLWATCNVGATKPEEYGDYFAWGEVKPKDEYSWKTYKWCGGSYRKLTKYCTNAKYGIVDNTNILDLEDDAAHVNWGGDWRMPTEKEQDELKNDSYTTWDWITRDGVRGYKVTSKVNGNSIFLPTAGCRRRSDLDNAGSRGYYWSSSPNTNSSGYAYGLYFGSGRVDSFSYGCYYGRSVRPVLRVEFTLSFVPNGGQGEMPAVVKPFKQAFTLPSCTFSRDGYEFIGWNTQSDGTGEKYEAGDTISLSANTTLYAQWNEIPTKENMHNGHEYVDLGLPSGTLWATCNVGANSPEEYGDYFAWGEVEPKDEYNWENYKWCDGNRHSINKYCNDSKYGRVDNKTILELCDDVANVKWGGAWRMPTNEEQCELINDSYTTWTLTTRDRGWGYKVTSKINGNSIFLPVAGGRHGSDLWYACSSCRYWSSSLDTSSSNLAYYLYFNLSGGSRRNHRDYGHSVRPVLRVEFTLSFVPNGGQGEMPAVVKPFKQAFTLPTCTFKRDGYEFIGWNTQPVGTGEKYEAGETISLSANTTLYAQWKEIPTKENMHNGHEYVDLGLPSGTLWATCNVGANYPEEYGDYFAWGEVEPKDEYNCENYKWCDGNSHSINKYCDYSKYGKVDNKTILELCEDVANVKWGGDWRMPTSEEEAELINSSYTTWTWINQNGIKGYKVTSKVNGNSIILPAAGFRNNSDLNNAGSRGSYWSSSLSTYDKNLACGLYFDSDNVYGYGSKSSRTFGQSVRPVLCVEFTLSFVPNGGQGEMPAVVKPCKQAFTLPTCTFKRDGYEFIGWNTLPDGTGEKYEAGDTISLSANTTLYAQWKEISTKENMHNGHEYVDFGLPSGTLWATCNVGATKPEEYGDYFAWGETEPSGDKYKEYKWFDDEERAIKYCNDKVSKYVDRIKELEFLDDAANFNWGGKWCMPNKKEFEELLECCIWNEVNKNGINGFEVISKTNGKSIFFIRTDYWSASVSLNNEYTAYELLLCSRRVHLYSAARVSRNAIRPIMRNEYTLSFDANGGEGDMLPIVKEPNENFRIPISTFNRFGFLFVGWNTKSNGTGITYLEEQEFNLSMNVELYAQWEEDTNIPNVHNGHEYVDLGLPSGTLWATCNIGATKPEENGDYFTWGSIYPTRKQIKRYKRIMPTSSLGCYFYGYCVDPMYGKVDNKTSLDLCDDAAFRWWGGTWSTPSALEQKELYNNCLWEREVIDGCIGYKAISKINGNSIFFPAAGFYDEDKRWYADGFRGEYWSKSICLERCKNAIFMTVCSRPSLANDKGNRCESRTIRPIMHIGLTLKFDSNGGQGEMISYTRLKNHIFRLPFNEFIMKECVFIEWNTNIDGSGDKYLEGQDICLTENITLYAQWKKIY